jgi:hypothetical protein
VRLALAFGVTSLLAAAGSAISASAGRVDANLFDPRIEPGNPTSFSPIEYVVGWDGCGNYEPPSVVRSGTNIDVTWQFHRVCGIPQLRPVSFGIGALPPGSYVVHVDPCDLGFGTPGNPCTPLASPPDARFTVDAAAELPSLGTMARVVLCLSLGGVAVARRRRAS